MTSLNAFLLVGSVGSSLFAQPANGSSAAGVPSVSVCQVLADPLKYQGQLIELTGLQEGTDEGAWLTGPECPGVLKTLGYVWPSSIWLQIPDSLSELDEAGFKYDFRSEKRVDRRYHVLRRKYPAKCIIWKYTGRLKTRADWSAAKFVYPNGSAKLFGFGHQGDAPAQLLLKQVDDVSVVPGCDRPPT